MPTYVYVCPNCALIEQVVASVADRDRAPVCDACSRGLGEEVPMRRQPTAASFTIKGFNAKNGYSK